MQFISVSNPITNLNHIPNPSCCNWKCHNSNSPPPSLTAHLPVIIRFWVCVFRPYFMLDVSSQMLKFKNICVQSLVPTIQIWTGSTKMSIYPGCSATSMNVDILNGTGLLNSLVVPPQCTVMHDVKMCWSILYRVSHNEMPQHENHNICVVWKYFCTKFLLVHLTHSSS